MVRIKTQAAAAARVLKKHYFVLVLVCIVSMFLGGEFFDTAQFIRISLISGETVDQEEMLNIYDVLALYDRGETDGSIRTAEELLLLSSVVYLQEFYTDFT